MFHKMGMSSRSPYTCCIRTGTVIIASSQTRSGFKPGNKAIGYREIYCILQSRVLCIQLVSFGQRSRLHSSFTSLQDLRICKVIMNRIMLKYVYMYMCNCLLTQQSQASCTW